jgi:hypothetical protein
LLLISKREEELGRNMRTKTCEEIEQMHEYRGRNPQGEIPFSIDVKGGERETLMRRLVTEGA